MNSTYLQVLYISIDNLVTGNLPDESKWNAVGEL